MQLIIRDHNGIVELQAIVPADLFQGFAQGNLQEIRWPIDSGPSPRIIEMRHTFE